MTDKPTPEPETLHAKAKAVADKARQQLLERGYTDAQIDDAITGKRPLPGA